MNNFFFERYLPEICRGMHKWCCKQILRHLRLFRAKKFFFQKLEIFWLFLHNRGHRFLEKWLTTFLRNISLKFVVDCTNGVANKFYGKVVSSEKFFFKNWKFFDFFCISGVTDFLKNDQLLFWEIPAWNLSWSAQMMLRTNFKAFKVVSSEKNFFRKLEIFWLFLHIRGNRFLEKWVTTFLRDAGLKFVVDCTNGVANEF